MKKPCTTRPRGKLASGMFSTITNCPLGCLAFKEVPTSSAPEGGRDWILSQPSRGPRADWQGSTTGEDPATCFILVPPSQGVGVGSTYSLLLLLPSLVPSLPSGTAACSSKTPAECLEGRMINTRWGSELAQSIIWGLLGRGCSRHLPFGQLAAEGTGRLGGAGRRWVQSLTAPVLTQHSSGRAPADRAPFPYVHSGLSLKPLLGQAAESRDANRSGSPAS